MFLKSAVTKVYTSHFIVYPHLIEAQISTYIFSTPVTIIFLPKSITGRILQLGHLEEDNCPIRKFSENKRYSSFFANGPIKFKVELCNC